MIVRRVTLTPIRMPLRCPLATGAGAHVVREGVLVQLRAGAGVDGWGEAMPLPGFGTEAASACFEALIEGAPLVLDHAVGERDAVLDALERALPHAPAARAGYDLALHDLGARLSGRSVASMLAAEGGARPRVRVPVNALVAAGTPEAAADAALHARARGFRTLKLKLGASPLARDLACVEAVRRAVGPDVAIRLDANGAWKEESAREALAALAAFSPEWVEQPVDPNDLGALARLRSASAVPVLADEAAAGVARAGRVIALGAADGIVLKLAPLGGLRPALRVAARARAAGLTVVVTTGLDAAVASAAALQLAAVLPRPLPACGLDTGRLLRSDLASAPEVVRGALELPRARGLGITPDPAAVARHASGPSIELASGSG